MAGDSVWMNAAFALDELHQDADFRVLAAVVGIPEQQQQPPLASPTAALGMESIAAFLSEMEQLSDSENAEPTPDKPVGKTAGCAVKRKPTKKKLSSLDRAKRDKTRLQQEISHMEQRIKRMRREQYERLAPIYAKQWKPFIEHELHRREILEGEQLQLRKRVETEQQKSQAALDLIEHMRALAKASSTTFSSFPPQSTFDSDQDAEILQVLTYIVGAKYQVLNHDLPIANEVSSGKLSADGAVVEYEFVRFLPFDMETISKVAWECAQSDFGSINVDMNEINTGDTLAIKQEFVVPIPNRHDVTLKILAVCKQFVSEDRTVIIWEGSCQWLTPTDGTTTTTHEQGSIVIESSSECGGVSVVKGCVRLTPINATSDWLSLMQSTSTLATIVLPSYQTVIDARHHLKSALTEQVTMKAKSSDADASGAGASVWMNAAFALDELHQDADFRAMSAEVEALEKQQQERTALASPTSKVDLNTLYTFLSEMEQLDCEAITGDAPFAPLETRNLDLDPREPATAHVSAVGASTATENRHQKPKLKKKKFSSLERVRLQKALHLQEIRDMEQQIKRIKTEHVEKLKLIYAIRWKAVFQHEAHRREILKAEQLQLRKLVEKEQLTSQVVMDLINKMLALSAPFTRMSFQPQLECEQDSAIFQMLEWSLAAKVQALDHALLANPITSELSFGKVNPDGAIAEHQFVRFLPFDMPTTSKIAWKGVENDFGSASTGLNKIYAADTLSVKQELVVPISSLHNVKLKIRTICKQIVSEGRTVLIWEGLIQWLTPADGLITTTHEYGSIAFEPLESCNDGSDELSTVKGFVRLTPVNSNGKWIHLAQNMAHIVLPSYEKLLDTRHQQTLPIQQKYAMKSSAEWMNAAFALDELHQDPDFRAMSADVEALEKQQQARALSASPTMTVGLNTLYAFLSEMEQLEEGASSTEDEPPQTQETASWDFDPLDPATVCATAIGASIAMENNYQKAKPKKKKLTTLDRTRREKAALNHEISLMEQKIKQIRREHYEKFARIYTKRWRPIIQREVDRKEILEAEQSELRKIVENEQQKWQTALELIEKMRVYLQASSAAFARVPLQPQLECDKDTEIFKMLAWSVGAKYQVVDHILPTNSAMTEMSFGKVSSDGMTAEHEFARIVPFDVPTTSKVSWECAKTDFGSVNVGLNKNHAADTISIKQDLVIPISSLRIVKLKVRAVCKKFVSEGRTVILWEGLNQWMASEDGMITTTHEQGSIVFEPLQSVADCGGLSTVKGFARLTPVNLDHTWIHLVQNTNALTRIVLPSYEKMIDARHQYVENHLIDAGRKPPQAFPAFVTV